MDAQATVGVIFDMDGVLVDSAAPHFESWRLLGVEQGVNITQEQFSATFGRQNRDIIPILLGEVSAPRWDVLSDRKEAIYRDLIRDCAPVVDGAVDLIRGLADEGVGLAVGSSGPKANIELVLDAMGVQDLVTTIVSADDVTRGKPDPQVFTLSCERLNLTPRRCVVVEDAPVGVEAARAAKTRSVAVLMHHPREAFSRADLIVDRLGDLTVEALLSLAVEQ